MTDDTNLPPLMLDDLRVSGPNRDEADAFEPSETWWAACDKIAAGYSAENVADLLLEMDLSDTSLLWCWWRDECMELAAHGAGREADCPDMLLIAALNAADVRAWRYPLVTGASVAALRAENAKLRATLTLANILIKTANDAGLLDDLVGHMHPDDINRTCDAIDEALGKEAPR